MDTSQKTPIRDERPDSEADLNLLLYKSGKAIKNFLVRIGRGLENIAWGFVLLLLYLFRNIGWLLLGLLLGIGMGIFFLTTNGSSYTSEMTVKANFNSARSLYSTVEYLNSLISGGKSDELAKVLNLPVDAVKKLHAFSVEPVKSEIITADMYKEVFMKNDRTSRVRQDTFWVRTVKYEDFKESLTDQDYPYQTIKVTSTIPSIYPQIEKGIQTLVSGNQLLKQAKEQQAISNREEEKVIAASIGNLDSLRIAYNERLMKGGKSGDDPASNQLMVMQNGPELKAPELELYNKMLELNDELRRVRNRSATENEILEIYAPFNPEGRRVSLFRSIWEYALLGLEIVVALLVLKLIYKSVVAYDTTIQKKKAAANIK